MEKLSQVKAKVLGVVLNRADHGKSGYYGYSYGTYGRPQESKPLATVTKLGQS